MAATNATSTQRLPCPICGEPASLRCAACKRVSYCGASCQRAHWRMGHKRQCAMLKAARERAAGMTEADARAALRELEEEVRRMDLRQAYQEMRRAQAEVARFQQGQRLARRAAEGTIHATPDGAAERASTVAQLTGYKPLPDGTRPPTSYPPMLPPSPPVTGTDEEEEDEALEAPPTLEEEEDDEERRYAVSRVTAELQPMLRCWVMQAWPPHQSRTAAAPSSIKDAAASVVWSAEEEGVGEIGEPRPVELRVRFRVEGAEGGGGGGEWFQAALPFMSTATGVRASGGLGQRRAVRLPVIVEADHVAVRVPLAGAKDGAGAASTALLDKLNARVDAAPAAVAAALGAVARERGGVALACRYCRRLVTQGGEGRRLQRFLPLPSEALDDVADFMLCFRDSVLPLSTDQLRARPGQGLCGEGFLLVHATDLLAVPARHRSITCPACGAALGVRMPSEGGQMEDEDVRLWGHALGAMAGGGTDLDYAPILERHFSLATHLALALRGAARRLKKRRFLLRCGGGGGGGGAGAGIELTVWGSEVAVLFKAPPAAVEGEGTPALRVTYQIREGQGAAASSVAAEGKEGCCSGHGHGHGEPEAVPAPSEALELTLLLEEWHAMAALLDASAARDFPASSHGPFAPARLAYLPLLPRGPL